MTLAVRSIIPTITFISPSAFRFPFSTFSQLDLQRQPRLDLPPSTSFQPSCRQSNRKHDGARSEEHTSELQSHLNLVCRLLLEKKKKNKTHSISSRQARDRQCMDNHTAR